MTAIAALAAAVLAGCGSSNDSTASGASTTSVSSTASAAESGAAAAPAAPNAAGPSGSASGGQAAPQTRPPLGPKEQAYLTALKKAGITPSDADSEINVARYICAAVKQNAPADQLAAIVDAVAGSDAKAAGKNVTDEDVKTLGATYINTAKSTYCQ
jgi:hypothetical protein